MDKATLHAQDGTLYFRDASGEEQIVLYRYPAGDCDTFHWPLDTRFRTADKQREQITIAMMDERETGALPVTTVGVILPDGTELLF